MKNLNIDSAFTFMTARYTATDEFIGFGADNASQINRKNTDTIKQTEYSIMVTLNYSL